MKKLIAFVLATALLFSLTACGGNGDDTAQDTTTTTSATTTTATAGEGTTTTTNASTSTGGAVTDSTTTTTTAGTTTTVYIPSGATVPIGTRPTTTTTQAPTQAPTGSGNTTTAATTTTSAVVKPTETPTNQPYIILPEIGTDIDVTKKKDRIRVSAVSAWFNEDGTIGVSLTFTNYTSNWITEETDYVEYTCYDKNGNVVQKATAIMIGCIDTKKNPTKAFDFNVPANTAEVRLTKSKIVYWTEWS